MSQPPLVSVIMPAYNCSLFVGEAINSVLKQTFSDFEFIIINDGSTDETKRIILSFTDPRIHYYENEFNLGIVKTLNRGIQSAKGKYILRTDADDMALSDMVEVFVRFMENNKDYIVCGGNMKVIDCEKIICYTSDNEHLKVSALSICPFSHSTVIIRKEILDISQIIYRDYFQGGEDHGLWSELLPLGKFHNLPRVTLLYRESDSQITRSKVYKEKYESLRTLIFRLQSRLYFGFNEENSTSYINFINCNEEISLVELEKMGKIVLKILEINKTNRLFRQSLLKRLLLIKWYWNCYNAHFAVGKRSLVIYMKYLIATKSFFRIHTILPFMFGGSKRVLQNSFSSPK
jgi:glycosyltransferase involved in cell wall biosynthesis